MKSVTTEFVARELNCSFSADDYDLKLAKRLGLVRELAHDEESHQKVQPQSPAQRHRNQKRNRTRNPPEG